MPAPEPTLCTSGVTWRTEGYGGPDNDVRLTALGELCVDVQRLARSTMVKISASDSPASSSSASGARNRFRDLGGTLASGIRACACVHARIGVASRGVSGGYWMLRPSEGPFT
jgi:hypothetical protein